MSWNECETTTFFNKVTWVAPSVYTTLLVGITCSCLTSVKCVIFIRNFNICTYWHVVASALFYSTIKKWFMLVWIKVKKTTWLDLTKTVSYYELLRLRFFLKLSNSKKSLTKSWFAECFAQICFIFIFAIKLVSCWAVLENWWLQYESRPCWHSSGLCIFEPALHKPNWNPLGIWGRI